jgi:DNA-directed RNA polymerase specialized sigma24 family protein
MKGARLRVADEEDVAQEAFWSFYRRFKAGGAPRLATRQDFLALVTTITACKAVNHIQHEVGVQKRGRGQVSGDAGLSSLTTAELDAGRTPEEEAILNDTYRHFVEGLPAKLRNFAELYLAGCTQREIAEQLHCGLRTAERKVALILAKWQEMGAEDVNAL